ncbi:MFS general substrate transporter [Cystobasidium minutum MCA 4210]|uniref:MFS general substrate transporter n=1 Tax=Cystobasidium minutum MCA 4210 TaxID=1397322 RepID=UPI0034CE9EF1|eukprot:jgi/Rhomi1/170801/fgenesh1_kg.4_\
MNGSVSTAGAGDPRAAEAGYMQDAGNIDTIADKNLEESPDNSAEKNAEAHALAPAPNVFADIPNGGLRAWLVVLGGWLGTMVSFGYISSFGVYQSYYELHQLANESPSNIAWIGSLQLFFIFFSGIFVGYAFDAGYYYPIIFAGSTFLLVGMFTTAQCTHLWQFILAQGVCGGIGCGFIFLPATAVMAHWFTTRRSFVYGITATGSSTGGVLFPIMLNRLFEEVGFLWAVRIVGFVTLACLIVVSIVMRPRLPPRRRGAMLELHHLRDPVLTLFICAMSLVMMGLYTPIFFLGSYAISKGIDAQLAFYILSILNATSILGRLVPNFFADRIGAFNIIYTASTLSGILNFVWLSTSSAGSIIAFGCIYGITSGSFVATVPACLANLTQNMNELGSRSALCFCVVAFAALCGSPITGALVRGTDFTRSACFSGSMILAGCCVGLVARYILTKRKGTWKV